MAKAKRAQGKKTAGKRAKKSSEPGVLRRSARLLRRMLLGPFGLVLLVVGVVWFASLDLTDLKAPNPNDHQPRIALLDQDGGELAHRGGRYGQYLPLDQISPWLPKAVVAIEDRRFYQHPGIDPIGIFRALMRNLQAGRVVQGGSTISQQLAKVTFLTPERSLVRKVKEALYTVWLEARFSKDEIIEAYLNRVYLGGGAYGADAAARRYFDKPAKDLSLSEAAMLAGLIRAPSRYAPSRDLERARARAGVVLDSMVAAEFISTGQATAARAAPAALARPKTRASTSYFADWVIAESRLYADAEQLRLTVTTTLDPKLQQAAQEAVAATFDPERDQRGVDQVALVALSLDGQVQALLGGRAYGDSQFNRVTQAERQPGSAFKLFVYLAALEAGMRPEDRISTAPIEVDGWSPRNLGDGYPAEMSLTDALAASVNTAAVRLAEMAGRDRVIRVAQRLGITSPLRTDPSLALGSSEVRLLELTAAYATVANGGRLVWPEGIKTITGKDGATLYQRRPIDEPVLEPSTVRAMTAMLETALRRGTGHNAVLRRFVAGKTGTSSEYRDAWFVGFTDALVVGVWVGNDDGRPTERVTGGGLPAQIFREFVLRGQGDAPFLPPPPPPKPGAPLGDLVSDAVDAVLGKLKGLFGG